MGIDLDVLDEPTRLRLPHLGPSLGQGGFRHGQKPVEPAGGELFRYHLVNVFGPVGKVGLDRGDVILESTRGAAGFGESGR